MRPPPPSPGLGARSRRPGHDPATVRCSTMPTMTTPPPPVRELETPEEMDEVMLDASVPTVIDFWSPTCGPCMAMADDFTHVASQFDADEVRFCKVNVTDHGDLATPFGVRSVPTIVFAHRGQVLDAVVGKMSAKQLGERTEWLVKKSAKKGIWSRLLG
ncbi:MAG: thioredoxin [Myxococcales bacterium FL481]|nr:MAG: thioredoxin [Myxococcales bacterium FL481]